MKSFENILLIGVQAIEFQLPIAIGMIRFENQALMHHFNIHY